MDKIKTSNICSVSKRQVGFSLVEVLVSFLILLILIGGVFELRLNSIRRTEKSGNLNQIQDKIRADIASVRKEALLWKCIQGACSGLPEDQYKPARYGDSHCSKANPLDDFPIASGTLTSGDDDVEISRNVAINENNKNQLDITYEGTNGTASTSQSTSIVPQAMNWCG